MLTGYLVVVSCGEDKIWKRSPGAGPTAAQSAYVSSPFRTSRRYAEHFGEKWLILSAKFGFIEPEFIIPENYNRSFYHPDAIEVAELRRQVQQESLGRFSIVGVLGSEIYWRRAVAAFDGFVADLRHVNGNKGFAPLFNGLIGGLVDAGTPFRVEST